MGEGSALSAAPKNGMYLAKPQPDGIVAKAPQSRRVDWSERWRGRTAGNGCWERCEYGTLADLAAAERISRSYVCRVLRLTLLAPDIVIGTSN